jgi:hypothetical protein
MLFATLEDTDWYAWSEYPWTENPAEAVRFRTQDRAQPTIEWITEYYDNACYVIPYGNGFIIAAGPNIIHDPEEWQSLTTNPTAAIEIDNNTVSIVAESVYAEFFAILQNRGDHLYLRVEDSTTGAGYLKTAFGFDGSIIPNHEAPPCTEIDWEFVAWAQNKITELYSLEEEEDMATQTTQELFNTLWEIRGEYIKSMHRNDRNMLLVALSLQQYFAEANPKQPLLTLEDCLGLTIEAEDDHTTDGWAEILPQFEGSTTAERLTLIQILSNFTIKGAA